MDAKNQDIPRKRKRPDGDDTELNPLKKIHTSPDASLPHPETTLAAHWEKVEKDLFGDALPNTFLSPSPRRSNNLDHSSFQETISAASKIKPEHLSSHLSNAEGVSFSLDEFIVFSPTQESILNKEPDSMKSTKQAAKQDPPSRSLMKESHSSQGALRPSRTHGANTEQLPMGRLYPFFNENSKGPEHYWAPYDQTGEKVEWEKGEYLSEKQLGIIYRSTVKNTENPRPMPQFEDDYGVCFQNVIRVPQNASKQREAIFDLTSASRTAQAPQRYSKKPDPFETFGPPLIPEAASINSEKQGHPGDSHGQTRTENSTSGSAATMPVPQNSQDLPRAQHPRLRALKPKPPSNQGPSNSFTR